MTKMNDMLKMAMKYSPEVTQSLFDMMKDPNMVKKMFILLIKEYLKFEIRYNLVWGYTSITSSTISNIPYNLIFITKFNDSSISITIISCDYLNLSLANEYVGDVTIPNQNIKYNQNFLQADQPIRLQYSKQIKLLFNIQMSKYYHIVSHVS